MHYQAYGWLFRYRVLLLESEVWLFLSSERSSKPSCAIEGSAVMGHWAKVMVGVRIIMNVINTPKIIQLLFPINSLFTSNFIRLNIWRCLDISVNNWRNNLQRLYRYCGYSVIDSSTCIMNGKFWVIEGRYLPSLFLVHWRENIEIHTGPEGFEPSTNCSAGSHSIQTELWAP